MIEKDLVGTSAGKKIVTYNFEVDEKLSAFILRNEHPDKKTLLNRITFNWKKKRHKNIIWINNPQYRFDLVPLQDYNKLFLRDIPIFISSCSEELAEFFKKNKFEVIKSGREAVLNLNENHFEKKSLKELVRAGFKRGAIEEVFYTEENCARLEQFKTECVHGKEPQLKHFFNDQFLPVSRLFVCKNEQNHWQGAILIAPKGSGKVITDLILRKKDSPRGTMEALVYHIVCLLKNEGSKTWSLGEVPYVIYGSKIFSKEFFINFAGRRFRYAYNYKGLFNFKNKFNPEWKNIYICCKPKLNIITLIKISWLSNLLKLIANKTLIYIENIFSI